MSLSFLDGTTEYLFARTALTGSVPEKNLTMSGLPGFSEFHFSHNDIQHPVYVAGNGPAILIMHELPGMVEETVALARRLQSAGFTTYMPLFFGPPGKKATYSSLLPYTLRLCISREFYMLKRNKTSPIVSWLRALCRQAFQECGGKGVGAIGMCLTGSYAIPLMLEPSMIAPVVSQPSLPGCVMGSKKAMNACKRSLDISPEELEHAKSRCDKEGLQIRGFKFSHDIISPQERFQRLKEEFGESSVPFVIDSGPENRHGYGNTNHAVFTIHYSDEPGSPTREAMDQLLEFYSSRLL